MKNLEVIKLVKNGCRKELINVVGMDTDKRKWDKYFDDHRECLAYHRVNHTIPNLIDRNIEKMQKRQAMFAKMSGGVTPYELKSILEPDEFIAISLFYGLENRIAPYTAIANIITREDGGCTSRQWINQLKQQAWKRIFEYKLKVIWRVPEFKVLSLLTTSEYKVISLYYGLDSKFAMPLKTISTKLKMTPTATDQLIASAELKLAQYKTTKQTKLTASK